MNTRIKPLFRVASLTLSLFALSVVAVGQGEKARPSLTGKYQGTAKTANSELTITLDLVDKDGAFSGNVTTQFGTFKIVKGNLTDDVLTLETEGNGTTGKFSLRMKDGKLVGQLYSKGGEGAVELARVTVDEISGEWDAAADAQGQPFPFTLVLKLDGEKVTGSSSSQLGTSQISTGTFKDGKLSVVLESGGGPIGLIATLDGGKLIGDFDYMGQLQGKWVAVRKK